MRHRHLLPNELDLLLDGEAGFGIAPLAAHVEECPACRARLADARLVVDALEALPHFAPTLRFADQVMAEVQIVEPWYAAPLEAFRRIVPQSRPMRVVTATSATVAAATMSALALWLALRADAALYLFGLVTDRARGVMVSGAAALAGQLLGQPGLDAIRSGSVGSLALGAGLLLAAVGGATFGFRALATAARRARE
ncbi:MAG TPA: hypothetical protein VJL28_03040 [Gemmatimonadaceae bacterium]|nr:hypothetical protein [Gemmatimonadaceae bacterium]